MFNFKTACVWEDAHRRVFRIYPMQELGVNYKEEEDVYS